MGKILITLVALPLLFACESPQEKLDNAIKNADMEYIVNEITHNATQIEIQRYKKAVKVIDSEKIEEDSLILLKNFLSSTNPDQKSYRMALAESLDSDIILTGCEYEERYNSFEANQVRYLIENSIFTFLACTDRDGREVSLRFDGLNLSDGEKIAWIRAQKFYSNSSRLLNELFKLDSYIQEAKAKKESIVDKHVVILRPIIGEDKTYTAYVNGNEGAVILENEEKANQKAFGLKLTFVDNIAYSTQNQQSISLPTWKEVNSKVIEIIENHSENRRKFFQIQSQLIGLTSRFFKRYDDIKSGFNITVDNLNIYCKSTKYSAFLYKTIQSNSYGSRLEEFNAECKKNYLIGMVEQDLIKYQYHYSLDSVPLKDNKRLNAYKGLIELCTNESDEGVFDSVKLMLNDRSYSDFKYFDSGMYLEELKKACPETMEKGVDHTVGSSLFSASHNPEFNDKLLINVCSSDSSESEYLDTLSDIRTVNNKYEPPEEVTDVCWRNEIIGDYFKGTSNNFDRTKKLRRDLKDIYPFFPRLVEATVSCHKLLNGKGHEDDLVTVRRMFKDLEDKINKFELRILSNTGKQTRLFEKYCDDLLKE